MLCWRPADHTQGCSNRLPGILHPFSSCCWSFTGSGWAGLGLWGFRARAEGPSRVLPVLLLLLWDPGGDWSSVVRLRGCMLPPGLTGLSLTAASCLSLAGALWAWRAGCCCVTVARYGDARVMKTEDTILFGGAADAMTVSDPHTAPWQEYRKPVITTVKRGSKVQDRHLTWSISATHFYHLYSPHNE